MSDGDQVRTRPPTIYDVAALAGVAPSTVSRALARPGRVSAATAERVREAVAEIGYRRSAFAPALNQVSSRLLALVVADIANPVFHDIFRGAQAAAEERGYTVVLIDAQESDARERSAIEQFLPAVDGILLSAPRMSDSGIRSIAKRRPVIVLNRVVRGLPSAISDNAAGSRRAAEHLGMLGHTEVTYLAGPESSWADGMRWRGLQEAGAELGLRTVRVGPHEPTVDDGAQAARQWAQSPTTAVVGFNDIMAIGFIRGLRSLGLQVPRDVSVVGFDNSRIGSLVTPALTSVAAPLREQAEAAVRHVIAIAGGARAAQQPLVVPTKLVARASTATRNPAPPWR